MRGRDELRARIRDSRATRVRQKSDVMTGARRSEKFRQTRRRRIVAELHDRDLAYRTRRIERLQKGARRLRIFNDEMTEAAGDGDRLRRKHVLGWDEAQEVRYKIQRARHVICASAVSIARREHWHAGIAQHRRERDQWKTDERRRIVAFD